MFKRIIYDSWHDWAPLIAFAFTFAFFLVMVIRGLALKKEQADRLSQLPLDDDAATLNPDHN